MTSDRSYRRSSSILSSSSANTKNASDISKSDELSEALRNQKIKQFKNLIKLDQLQNPSQIAALNNLQDSDLKDLNNFIDQYLNNCLREIDNTDSVFSVAINNQNIQNNYTIKLESLNPLDFLKNGLKSGTPLLISLKNEPKDNSMTNSLSSLPKISSPKSSIVSMSKFQASQLPPVPIQQPVLNLNCLLVLNLNREYFKIEKENLNFFKVKLIKRPNDISLYDYDQISIDIGDKKEAPVRARSHYQQKSCRYLNSRALTDRLIRYFNYCLKNNWPKKTLSTNPGSKMPPNEASPSSFNEENRKCVMKNNQILISFEFNGTKSLKDAKINLFIDIAVKLEDMDKIDNVEETYKSVLQILNQYSNDSGLEILNEEKYKKLCTWLIKTFNFNISSIHICPTYLHLWNINSKLVKINLLKFLVWFDTIRLTNTNLASLDHVYQIGPLVFKQNFFQTIQSSASPIYMFGKLLQLFLSNCFSLLKEDTNTAAYFDSEFYEPDLLMFENEDLILNLILSEIKNNGVVWSSENLLDKLWIALTNLRSYLFLTSHLPDPFNRFTNQMPKFYLKCTGYLNLSSASSSQIFGNRILNLLNNSFEVTMKTLLTKVITEEIDFSSVERSLSEMGNRRSTVVISPVINKDINKPNEKLRNEKNYSNAATRATSRKTDK
ncbi:hypothetical protein BpHYR1_009527 [Brachionus plicatilis]|uniref:Uncharacterized protein n=1 Tax=Brachionus plicatilis TaxID=10195 RepID=A0A3M7SU33_BRAPC|nr:hypothetical protein BpHYR1_009527 [Brachionus plicatilis]